MRQQKRWDWQSVAPIGRGVDSARPESAGRSSSEKHIYVFPILSLSLFVCFLRPESRRLSLVRVAKGFLLDAAYLMPRCLLSHASSK
jgi:hypothetical protein